MDGLGGMGLAAKISGLWPGQGGGGGCGPPYTESYDHEFVPGSGSQPGTGPAYCEKCGVYQGMHGQGGGGGIPGGGGGGGEEPGGPGFRDTRLGGGGGGFGKPSGGMGGWGK